MSYPKPCYAKYSGTVQKTHGTKNFQWAVTGNRLEHIKEIRKSRFITVCFFGLRMCTSGNILYQILRVAYAVEVQRKEACFLFSPVHPVQQGIAYLFCPV